jgi:prepilin-type N-terminal cleavage/methylation domain-containing protein
MRNRQQGFSLVELMIVIILLLVVMGAIFQLMNTATKRSSTEQAKLDSFQEAREFMDQMSRDLRIAGYPSPRNVSQAILTAFPVENDTHAAAGLVMVDSGELWFEADVDGTGVVSVVHYLLDTSTTNGCPCLKRSQLPKVTGNPYTEQTTPVYQTEVQGVQNTNIFSAFVHAQTGTPATLPITYTDNAHTLAAVDTIQAVLTVQSTFMDPDTKVRPISTLAITVKLNNCSQAANGEAMSCR